MNCENCAGPLELGDHKTVLTCEYCGSTQRLIVSSDDGDRVIPMDQPTGLNCPRCEQELVKAAIDGRNASYCGQCLGILVEAPIFAEISWTRRIKYRGPDRSPSPIDPQVFTHVANCPSCQQPMEVHPHYGAGRAVIDSCNGCHLVWLDHDELTNIERTPGRRR